GRPSWMRTSSRTARRGASRSRASPCCCSARETTSTPSARRAHTRAARWTRASSTTRACSAPGTTRSSTLPTATSCTGPRRSRSPCSTRGTGTGRKSSGSARIDRIGSPETARGRSCALEERRHHGAAAIHTDLAAAPVRSGGRDGHEEPRALPLLALHPDTAAVRLHDALGDGEAEADAPAAGVACLPEAVEQVRKLIGRDAGPRVADLEADLVAIARDVDAHAATFRREFDGVADQVAQRLQQAVAVGAHHRRLRLQAPQLEVERFLLREDTEGVVQALEQRRRAVGPRLHHQPPGFDAP